MTAAVAEVVAGEAAEAVAAALEWAPGRFLRRCPRHRTRQGPARPRMLKL